METPSTGAGNKSETGERQTGRSHRMNEARLVGNLNIFAAKDKERNLPERNKKSDLPVVDKLEGFAVEPSCMQISSGS